MRSEIIWVHISKVLFIEIYIIYICVCIYMIVQLVLYKFLCKSISQFIYFFYFWQKILKNLLRLFYGSEYFFNFGKDTLYTGKKKKDAIVRWKFFFFSNKPVDLIYFTEYFLCLFYQLLRKDYWNTPLRLWIYLHLFIFINFCTI